MSAYTLTDHYAELDAAYERRMDMDQRFEEAAERAGVALYDRLVEARKLGRRGHAEALLDIVRELVACEGGPAWLDKMLEHLSQDVDEAPTHLVMRWAGETEYLP